MSDLQVTENIEESISTSIEGEIPQTTPENEAQTEDIQVAEVSEETQVTPEVDLTKLTFEGLPVVINVPDDIRELAESKGFAAEKLIHELYSSDKFEFSPETRTALDEAYGKTYVDFMLKGLKAEMDTSVKSYKESVEAKEKAEKDAFDNALSIVGGEEGWAALEQFANSKGESYLEGLNSAMQSGNRWLQEAALKAALSEMKPSQAQPQAEAEKPLELIEGDGKVASPATACSAAEYRTAISNGDYYKNPAYWDNLRRAGQKLGI